MKRFLFAILLLVSTAASAGNFYFQTMLSAVAASSNQLSTTAGTGRAGAPFDVSKASSAAFQITWASLTGTLDAEVTIEASNDGANWVARPGATMVINTASGTDMITFNGTASERFYRVRYTKNSVAGGTITVKGVGK